MITIFEHYEKLSDADSGIGHGDEDAPKVVKFMAQSLRECGFLPEDMSPLVDEAERLCGVAGEAEVVSIRVSILKRCDNLLTRLGSPSVSFPPPGWDTWDQGTEWERASWYGMRALSCMFYGSEAFFDGGENVVGHFIDYLTAGGDMVNPSLEYRMVEIFDECVFGKIHSPVVMARLLSAPDSNN